MMNLKRNEYRKETSEWGSPTSTIMLRVSPELHAAIKETAYRNRKSMNEWLTELVAKNVTQATPPAPETVA